MYMPSLSYEVIASFTQGTLRTVQRVLETTVLEELCIVS